jgi:hypothetical protein
MLDQEIPPARSIGQETANFYQRLRIDLAPLRRTRWPAPPVTSVWPAQSRLLDSAHR